VTSPLVAEASPFGGRPVQVFKFLIDETGLSYNYTTFRRAVTYQGVYEPLEGLTVSAMGQGQEDDPSTIAVTVPADTLLAAEFRNPIPPARAMLATYVWHRPPVDNPDDALVWANLFDIVSAAHSPDVTTLTCASLLGQGDMLVPSGLLQRDYCDFATYDPETCKADPDDFKYTGTVTAIDGLAVTVGGASSKSGIDLAYFTLGDFAFNGKHVMIKQQGGDIMLLDEWIPGLGIGSTVTIWAGDPRDRTTCRVRFNNIARFRGFVNMPTANPFYGRGLAS
jgi:hypothetical protein